MSPIPIAAIEAALLRKGFQRVESKHHQLWFVHNGRRTSLYTWFSHGEKQADDWLIAMMTQQLRLTKREFLRLIQCEISGDDYARLMTERGYLRT